MKILIEESTLRQVKDVLYKINRYEPVSTAEMLLVTTCVREALDAAEKVEGS